MADRKAELAAKKEKLRQIREDKVGVHYFFSNLRADSEYVFTIKEICLAICKTSDQNLAP